jgi:hypothetical protein
MSGFQFFRNLNGCALSLIILIRIVFVFYGVVAFTREFFERRGIQNAHFAALVFDVTAVLQRNSRLRHARAIGPEHGRKKFLRQGQVIGFDSVAAQQKPANQPLIEQMQAIANSRLTD